MVIVCIEMVVKTFKNKEVSQGRKCRGKTRVLRTDTSTTPTSRSWKESKDAIKRIERRGVIRKVENQENRVFLKARKERLSRM